MIQFYENYFCEFTDLYMRPAPFDPLESPKQVINVNILRNTFPIPLSF